MKTTLFSSDRSFVLFSYAASHGLLLFRSRKTKLFPNRLDILFQDVRAMEVRSWFDGVVIVEETMEYVADCYSHPAGVMEIGNKIYRLVGKGWEGYVVGGIMLSHEDDGDFMEPSKLLG